MQKDILSNLFTINKLVQRLISNDTDYSPLFNEIPILY